MNRPIFIILIGYIIGIIWGLYFKMSIVFFYAMLLISYIIINKSYKKKKLKMTHLYQKSARKGGRNFKL